MTERYSTAPIAIIGMGCRFSGDTDSPEKLWEMVVNGRSGWTDVPVSRFNIDGLYHPNGERVGSTHVRGGHFLNEDVAVFDASFFNISSEVASTLDPQYRMELEVVYEALESAGIPIGKTLGSNTSVYAGMMFRDYHDTLSRDPDMLPRYFMTSNAATMASNRISHFYDLRGPSMSVDTGCSTTLTALHLACQSLRNGESNMSIVTGASLMTNPDVFISMSNLGFLSPDGLSFAFDSRANGYGRGEGVAAIIIKTLDDALRDGDCVRAVIRETALNQNGKTSTITAPSQAAQEDVIRSCYHRVGLDPLQTTYVEAHGTGTPIGDPLEVAALAAVLGKNRTKERPLYLGSVKTNVGHTEATSGLASIIKTTLALEKGLIAPNAHFKDPNEKLSLDERNIKAGTLAPANVPTTTQRWPLTSGVRRASVNNFGFGGANAHAILEWHNPRSSEIRLQNKVITNGVNGASSLHGENCIDGEDAHMVGAPRTFLLSAKDQHACHRMVSDLKEYLAKATPKDEEKLLDSLAYTLGSRRSVFLWSAAYPANSLSGLVDALDSGHFKPARSSESVRLGWVFTGQGAQWYGMGRELIATYPVFKAAILECDRYIKDMGSKWTLTEELYRDEKTSQVNNAVYSLPMSTAIQISLVQLLWSWGITPTAVTSHSSGEVAAAYAAGALSARSAISIAYLRGFLASNPDFKSSVKGGMIAVGMGREAANEYISSVTSGRIVVACINSQSSVTISGDITGILELEQMLHKDQIFARRLKISEAFHSDHMLPMAEPFASALMGLLKPEREFGSIIYASPKTGARLERVGILASPSHWVESMLLPVEFESAFRNMCFANSMSKDPLSSQDVDIIVEVGPHAALGGPIQEMMTLPEFSGSKISYLKCLVRGKDSVDTMQQLAIDLIHKGYRVNVDAINFPHGRDGVQILPDLPRYPWNHQTRYWMEPRLNKAYRQRQHMPHDLLGSFQVSANSFTPTWRNIIRVSDVPWIRDHVVQSNIVYPGAGLVSMVIEGITQIIQAKSQSIVDYHLRDVDFAKALIIPENDEGAEVQLTIRQCDDKAMGTQGWHDFRIYSVAGDNTWTEHCKGLISVDIKAADEEPNWSSPALRTSTKDAGIAICTRHIDPRAIWAAMRSVGIHHGPTFQNLICIQSNKKVSITTFSIADTASMMPNRYQREHVIHPTTLDSVFQAAYGALPAAGERLGSAFIPRLVKKLLISSNISNTPGHRFKSYASLDHLDSQSFRTGLTVFDQNEASPTNAVLEIGGLVCQSVGAGPDRRPDQCETDICSAWKWRPDISFLDPKSLKDRMIISPQQSEIDKLIDLRRATLHYIYDTVTSLTTSDVLQLEWHHKKLYNWMKEQLTLASKDKFGPGSSQWLEVSAKEKNALLEKVAASSVNGEMICHLGPRILAILRHEIAPLELMLEKGLLSRYYIEALKWGRSNKQASELVQLCAHKNPRAKILEIGAGTGGCTQVILEAFGQEDIGDGKTFGRYDFTDISSGFFEAARDRFAAWQDLMTFRKLDIETDPTRQDFECGSYDVVIACQVLHATTNMEHTLANVRKLLKPGGKLILVETTRDELDVFFTFGLLPGWWLSEEDERKSTPSLSVPFWHHVLTRSGFTGLDLEVHDCESEDFYSLSTIMSTATHEPASFHSDIAVVYGNPPPPEAWLSELQEAIAGATGHLPAIEQLDRDIANGKICIFLGELDQSVLTSKDNVQFKAITSLATNCKGLLWVAHGGAMECENPHQSLHLGILRTLRSEYSGKRYISLDVDPKRRPWTAQTLKTITEVFITSFGDYRDSVLKDFEYAERDGVVFIPRAFPDSLLNKTITSEPAHLNKASLQPLYQPGRPLRMDIQTPGLIDTLCFKDDLDAAEELASEWVEIDPKAFGLNFRDVMVAMGQLEANVMGFECSGTIVRLGVKAASHGLKVGDRVCALLRGGWSNRPRAHWTAVILLPGELSYEEAASIPLAFTTAYVSLYDTARLKKGEKVLIHAAAGGVGQAAIILSQLVGAEIFVTVGTEAKRNFLMEKYSIPTDHIFSSREPSFAEKILATTDGKGIDVVLNSLAGKLLQASFDCLCEFGRFVEIGKRDLEQNNRLDMHAFTRNVSFSSIDLLTWESRKGNDVARVMSDIARLLEEKTITLIGPITVYPISAVEQAFRLMQAGQHMGKIVITVNLEDNVAVMKSAPSLKLCPDASYLIVGGLGGIGRSLCEWIVDRGAKHLIILSRSARAGPHLAELEQAGCKVRAVGCDVSDESQMAWALQSCADMPPIRGVIQGAMVLHDSIFEQMTIDDFNVAVRPKMQGSWNLHRQLNNVDFFIMLSSLMGVMGGASQANYAAGGAFQDALASYRRSRGLPAVTIDLGMVKTVGYVASTREVSDRLARIGFKPISEDEVLRILESVILSPSSAQVITGINRQAGSHWDEAAWINEERFASLRYRQMSQKNGVSAKAGGSSSDNLRGRLSSVSSLAEAEQVILKELTQKLQKMFGLMEDDISPLKPLAAFGVDSLISVEFRNWLASQLRCEFSIFDLMQSPSLTKLSATIASRCSNDDPALLSK